VKILSIEEKEKLVVEEKKDVALHHVQKMEFVKEFKKILKGGEKICLGEIELVL